MSTYWMVVDRNRSDNMAIVADMDGYIQEYKSFRGWSIAGPYPEPRWLTEQAFVEKGWTKQKISKDKYLMLHHYWG